MTPPDGEQEGPVEEPSALSREDTAAFAERIRELLEDPAAGLTSAARHRWEGALAALDAVLGLRSTLTAEIHSARRGSAATVPR